MNEGIVLLSLSAEAEAAAALGLSPRDYSENGNRPFTVIQNSLFDLGALEATILERQPKAEYRGIFTRVFMGQYWQTYVDYLEFLNQCGAEIEALFKLSAHRIYHMSSRSGIETLTQIGSDDAIPGDLDAILKSEVSRIREWSEITDLYVHIPPPSNPLRVRW